MLRFRPIFLFISTLKLIFIFASENVTKQFFPEPLIVGGVKATLENTRHQISLRAKSVEEQLGFGHGFYCSGTLIHRKYAITAAQCFFNGAKLYKPSDLVAVMGTLNIMEKTKTTHVSDVANFGIHQDYNIPVRHANDIALLELTSEVPMNHPTIRPIPVVTSVMLPGTKCTVSGWGTSQLGGGRKMEIRIANIQIEDIKRCNSSVSYSGRIPKGSICAGNFNKGGVDSCQYDAGGPLVCNNFFTGVVSWGNGCGAPKFPGIYADVNYYRQWIAENIGFSKASIEIPTPVTFLSLVTFYIFFF